MGRRKAAVGVVRAEEEIAELLGGTGMWEKDKPQVSRMKQMAYDGMLWPGEWLVCVCMRAVLMHAAAELQGLMYKFDWFLYPNMQPMPTIMEKTVWRWDEEWR